MVEFSIGNAVKPPSATCGVIGDVADPANTTLSHELRIGVGGSSGPFCVSQIGSGSV